VLLLDKLVAKLETRCSYRVGFLQEDVPVRDPRLDRPYCIDFARRARANQDYPSVPHTRHPGLGDFEPPGATGGTYLPDSDRSATT
jgi:hypothetical protein